MARPIGTVSWTCQATTPFSVDLFGVHREEGCHFGLDRGRWTKDTSVDSLIEEGRR